MKKILFKTSSLAIGGLERVQIEFVNYLSQNPNYQFLFVVENDMGSDNIFLPTDAKIKFIKTQELCSKLHYVRQNKNKSLIHKIKYNWTIMKERRFTKQAFNAVVQEFQPDIAINFNSDYDWHFECLHHSKNIVWIHHGIVSVWHSHTAGLRHLKQANKYDKIVCVSKGIMKEAIELMPTLTNKTTYLYNPQDFKKIKLMANEEFLEEERQLANEKFILMVSRIEITCKDFKTLIDAFDIAKGLGYDGKLYIVGGGSELAIKQLSEWINAAKYKNEIKWLGAKPNPYKWMQACDKFVLSSHSEGFAIVLTEALAVNDTVISSDCQWGPSEILGDDEYGWLFPVGDAKRLGELMVTATGKSREQIDKHLEQFSRAAVMKQFVKILEE